VGGVGPEQEAGDHAEVSASASERPEQVGVLLLGSGDKAAVGEHDVPLDQIVHSEAVLAAKIAMAAAQRESGDAGGRDDPERHGLTEGVGRVIDVAGRAARARPDRLLLWVDPHALHCREVDDQAVVDAAETRTIVSATANGDGELIVPAEIHRHDDICDVGAMGDEQRSLVDHGVVEFSRLFIFGMAPPDQRASKALAEFGDGLVVHGFAPDELAGKHHGL
jgi:hypothetical protein